MKPRVLALDIETSPNLVHVWGLFDQNIGINQIIDAGYILCWSAKWIGEKEVFFKKMHDKDMLTHIHSLLEEADAVVHYNGQKFDIPTLNKEFIKAGLKPPSPYKQIDLLRVVRKQFKFPSNKLAYIVEALGIGKKGETGGHELWIACMDNDPAAWRKMEKYNRKDVALLEPLYLKLTPWISMPLNHGLFSESNSVVCSSCGSSHLQSRGTTRTKTQTYQRFQCRDCGTWSRAIRAEAQVPKNRLVVGL